MAVESGLPPMWGTLLDWEMGRETGEGGLNEGVAVLRGLVTEIESVIESLSPADSSKVGSCQVPQLLLLGYDFLLIGDRRPV